METESLGRTGMQVSRIGLGTMVLGAWGNTDLAACHRIINRALDAGVTLVDTADVYGAGENESIVGEAIATRRSDVVLCTKFRHPVGDHDDPARQGASRRWIMQAVDDSLRRLGTDWIDLYQVHRPDPSTDIAETVDALSDLVRAGKIRAWGTSTFPAEDLVFANWAADRCGAIAPHAEQPPYSILCRGIERDVLPVAAHLGTGVLVWSPLSGGWLTGKYRRASPAPADSRAVTNPDHFDGGNAAKLDAVERLADIARAAGLSLTHLAVAWCLEHPAVNVALVGARTEDQLVDLLGAAGVRLDRDTLDAIDEVVPPGVDLNPADPGWTPPGLDRSRRRRSRTS